MKYFFRTSTRRFRQAGFSLVEVMLSVGLFSFGFVALVPLLALGLNTARHSHDEKTISEIARTLAEEARAGNLTAGSLPLDQEGHVCTEDRAVYTAQASFAPVQVSATGGEETTPLTRLTVRIVPRGAPDHARVYAVVFPAQS